MRKLEKQKIKRKSHRWAEHFHGKYVSIRKVFGDSEIIALVHSFPHNGRGCLAIKESVFPRLEFPSYSGWLVHYSDCAKVRLATDAELAWAREQRAMVEVMERILEKQARREIINE